MHIFNHGKYKSLHAQQPGELNAIRNIVLSDKHFRPSYHLSAPTGLLNDPNGLVFDGENYHIFYQWFPYDAIHGMKHWKHLITRDFHTFYEGDSLIPDEHFESHGCYSGGAILWQDHIVAFYTGNVRRASDNQRVPHQNIAIFNKAGKLLSKRCILECAPRGYTEHVRDPNPFITQEGKIRFIVGAQRRDMTGTALIYEMDNLDSSPRLLSELTVTPFDNTDIFMWECPDLFQLGGNDVFIWSPQGKPREQYQFQNNYHAIYALGELQDSLFKASHIEELDYGFDFYAPQTVENSDRLLLGWVGLPDLYYPTDLYKWHSMLSLPRQISVKNGKIVQRPYLELGEPTTYSIHEPTQLEGLDTSYLQISVENRPLVLTLFTNKSRHQLELRYENGRLTLDRSRTEQTDVMQQWGSERHCEIEQLQTLEIFIDRSIIEIFVNGGEKVLTSRFFIASRQNLLKSSRPIEVQIAKIAPIHYQEKNCCGTFA